MMNPNLNRRLTKLKAENHYTMLLKWIIWICLLMTTSTPITAHPYPITNTNYFNLNGRSNSEVTAWPPASYPYRDWTSQWHWQTTKPTRLPISIMKTEAHPWNFDPRKDDLLNWDHKLGTDNVDVATSVVEVIVYIVIALVILSFISFLVCICCPICVFAKIRHRRRGHIYARQNGVSATVATTTLTNPTAAPQAVAVANPRSNTPYPVQETVTVIPLVQQQPLPYAAPINYQQVQNFGTKPPTYLPNDSSITPINSNEPPPPYPGLPDNLQQHPYNPYFSEQSGPPPQQPQ